MPDTPQPPTSVKKRKWSAKAWQLLIGGCVLAGLFFAVLQQGFEQVVFFYTPQEILAEPQKFQARQVRMGALVRKGSTAWNPERLELRFEVTEDAKHYIPVVYSGIKPDLYREGQGVVVEGRLGADNLFRADTLLVKHSEEYSVDQEKINDKEALYRTLSAPAAP